MIWLTEVERDENGRATALGEVLSDIDAIDKLNNMAFELFRRSSDYTFRAYLGRNQIEVDSNKRAAEAFTHMGWEMLDEIRAREARRDQP